MPNSESLDRLRDGGQAALADLFSQYRDRLARMVCLRLDRRIAHRVDPSDVVQEAFIDAMRQLDRYVVEPPMSPLVWLRFLTGQRLMALHRHHLGVKMRDAKQEVSLQRFSRPEANSYSMSGLLLGRLTSPSRAMERQELQSRLEAILDDLEPIDREILALRHYEELTNAETAEELGISAQASSKRYIRALERLRKEMEGIPGFELGS